MKQLANYTRCSLIFYPLQGIPIKNVCMSQEDSTKKTISSTLASNITSDSQKTPLIRNTVLIFCNHGNRYNSSNQSNPTYHAAIQYEFKMAIRIPKSQTFFHLLSLHHFHDSGSLLK